MKFGQSAEEAAKDTRGSGGGAFMKYPRQGDNVVRILDEPSDWVYYWEHFNPDGFAFPCTNDRDTCPGCTSDIEKMKNASRKVAFNAYDGTYVNVWKVPNQSVAEKLKARFERYGTITDRDYLIRQVKTANRTDYDVEGLDKNPHSKDAWEELQSKIVDPEDLLAQAYEDAWGDSAKVREAKVQPKTTSRFVKSEPKAEPKTYQEAELRTKEPWDLAQIAKEEGLGDIPPGTDTSDEIVDWMLSQV